VKLYNLSFTIGFVFYIVATLSYVSCFILRRENLGKLGFFFSVFGFLLHTLSLFIRVAEFGHPPISNLYESLSFFAWAVVLIYLFIEGRAKIKIIGVFALPFVIFLLGWASFMDSQIRPLPPALRSFWLGIHGGLCFLSYASFTLAFYFGVMYLLQEREVKTKRIGGFFFRLPSLAVLDKLSYRTVTFGFILLTLGIISGSIWASQAWGAFWSWDPKETWSLVSWLIYVFYLHARLMRGWRGRKSAYVTIIGFLTVIFTYLGVSFFLPGLHSYL
jgi:cytochrome c-type biogenesis protein CcsB